MQMTVYDSTVASVFDFERNDLYCVEWDVKPCYKLYWASGLTLRWSQHWQFPFPFGICKSLL